MRRRCGTFGAVLAATFVVAAGCSTGDGAAGPSTSVVGATDATPDGGVDGTTDGPAGTTADGGAPVTGAGGEPVDPSAPGSTPAPVPETGVPGLDSDDEFCRAWSRFGGSFQVVAVAASFSDGPPSDVYTLEVVASPVVAASYDELLDVWPTELAAERDAVADDFLGPYARRSAIALAALEDAGADDTARATIAEAWLTTLASRDPSTPDVVVDLPDELWDVVDIAAADLASAIVPVPADPSLVTAVEVPLTEQYLADTCPDQGTLGGTEIDG